MKKQFFRVAAFRQSASKWVLAALLVGGTLAATAQVSATSAEIKTASVKYLGTQNDQRSFRLTFDNDQGDRFDVLVKDREGDLLYQGSFTDKKFNKTFVVPTADETMFRFFIKNLRTKQIQSFEVNTVVVEEVLVKRVS